MAKVMAILIAALIDRGADNIPGGRVILKLRNSDWLNWYNNKIMQLLTRVNVTQDYLIALALFVPLVIALFLLQMVFVLVAGTIGKVLFMALALLYFLGNVEAGQQDSPFVQEHERSYAILFWFTFLGPVGALLYWFLIMNQKSETIGALVAKLHGLAAWIPARITGFIYGLVGHFTATFKCWLGCMTNPTLPSSQVLVDCGRAAVDTSVPNDEVNLASRAYIAWVVLCIVLIVLL